MDITFALPEDVPEVNSTNCINSTDITFNNVYSIPLGSSGASHSLATPSLISVLLAFSSLVASGFL